MRYEPSFLKDILTACDKLNRSFLQALSKLFFSEVLPAAVLHHLTVIGEAASRLSISTWIGKSSGTHPTTTSRPCEDRFCKS
jgi:uncharacterized protein with HEPN domain